MSIRLKDIYRPDAVTIDLHDDLAAAARRMELAQVGALAVVNKAGQLVGVFTERDLVRATGCLTNSATLPWSLRSGSNGHLPCTRRLLCR